jgi:hypothetical protein
MKISSLLKCHWAALLFWAVWAFLWGDWTAFYFLPQIAHWGAFSAMLIIGWIWFLRKQRRVESGLGKALLCLSVFILTWHYSVFLSTELSLSKAAHFLAKGGLGFLFVIGLILSVLLIDRKAKEFQLAGIPSGAKTWHLANLNAWYFRRSAPKLDQSLWSFLLYTLAFILLVLFLTNLPGCRELYEMPAGGGEQAQRQKLKIEVVKKKKFVINPFSSIIFNPPPIEDVKLQLEEITKHAYQVGYGQGQGSGFSGGTNRGKVRFIRLEYQGGDWDQDFSGSSDVNMLMEYGIRTGHKVAKGPESRKISQLKNFPLGKSPPFLYITGQKNLIVSKSEFEVLREYLIDKHGMLFADNGGSAGWGQRFFGLMQQVLPKVKPVKVPLDHPIHTTPNPIPFLPYVAPHGGKDAWGWVVDGRLVAYYHPGDIGDAWADDHAKVKREIYEYCYQLGTNVIFYAHVEYNKWLDSLNQEKK